MSSNVDIECVMIILNWNCVDDTILCVDSIFARSGLLVDIVIIDNNSTDNSTSKLLDYINTSHYKTHISLICNEKNKGYTGGINLGFHHAVNYKYKYVGVINPDATIGDGYVEELLRVVSLDNDTVVATGVAVDKSSIVESMGLSYPCWGTPAPLHSGTPAFSYSDEIIYPFGFSGSNFILETRVLDLVGYFDDAFFMYYEDIDLSFRIQLAGFKIVCSPRAFVVHEKGKSSSKVSGLTTYNTFKNLPMLFWKNVPLGLMPKILPRFFVAYHLILGNAIMRGKAIPALKGWLMSIFLFPRSLVLRWKIQSSKKVSTNYISSIILHDIPPDQTGLRKFRKFFTGKA